MGGAHSHGRADDDTRVETARTPRLMLLCGLAVAALATIIGLVVLWPSGEHETADFAAEGVTFPEATVQKVYAPCPIIIADPATPPEEHVVPPKDCGQMDVELADGKTATVQGLPPAVSNSGLQKGDKVLLQAVPHGDGSAAYSYFGTNRNLPIGVMAGLFALVVLLVARLRGLLALVGLAVAGVVVVKFMLPALLDGSSGFGVAVVGSAAIMFVVLYLAHGPTVRTSTALAGTLTGVGITALLGLYVVDAARLTGVTDETGELLQGYAEGIDPKGLLTCAIIIAGLGILNDVTITQSSSVWELRAAAPEMPRRKLFTSAMRIGRDHIASTIYTIVFVYAGTALSVLLLLSLYDRPVLELLTDESIAEEVMRTLASAIGLVLAVPATTAIAAATVAPPVAPPAQRSGR